MTRTPKADGSGLQGHEEKWALELAQKLVERAQALGADASDATAGVGASLSAKARDGEVEDITRSSSRGAGVRVIVQGKMGFATAAEAPRTDAAVHELVENAIALAGVSSASPHNVIPEATAAIEQDQTARVRQLQLWDPVVAEASAGWATEQALWMERVLRQTPGITSVRDVAAATSWGVFALATSRGFSGAYGGTSAHLSASGVVDDGDGKKQVDGWWSASRFLNDLESPESVAQQAAARTLAHRGAQKIRSTEAPVIFDPMMARGFFAAILSAMNGDAVARRSSFLADRLGQVVLVPGIRCVDNPSVPRGFGSRPFDDEGVRVDSQPLIDESGTLRSWLLDGRSASRLGLPPTGHASRSATGLPHPSASNVQVLGGRGDLDAMVRETERGLLVTSLLGHSPDLVTGEYSRGASGFWIENGEIAHAVEEVTIAGHMLEMMSGLDRVGDDLDCRSSLQTPSIRFANLSISGA